MKTVSRSARGFAPLALGTALAVMCRTYEVDHPDIVGSKGGRSGSTPGGEGGTSGMNDNGGHGPGGGGLGGVGDGGEGPGGAGAAGDGSGGASGSAGANGGSAGSTAGKSGQGGGGTGGTPSGGTSGASGDDAGGESGGGSGPTTPPESGIFGAVRVLVDGEPRCGGSLITNDWVLTADQCVTSYEESGPIVVGFGMNARNFKQTERVVEVRRFPGNDGTVDGRGRDLLLLGVEHPFEIEGRTNGYYRPVWHMGPEYLLTPHVCVGWDFRVSTTSPTESLHQEIMAPFAIDLGVVNGAHAAGNRLWWLNTSADPEQGVLPMPADVGSACFQNHFDVTTLDSIHTGNPLRRRNNAPNVGREAYSVVLGEGVVHGWLRTELFDAAETPLELTGSAGGCASGRDRLELFGRLSDDAMAWWSWDGSWTERETLPGPGGVILSAYKPGAYCTSAGTIELFATDTDGAIWWQRMNRDRQWSAQWQRVSDATTPVDSGIAVAGVLPDHFYVFARASSLELRVAEFDGGWAGGWTHLGGLLHGTPTVRMPQEGHIDIFSLNIYDEPWQTWMDGGNWGWWIFNQEQTTSEPAVVSWGHNHLDVLTRSQEGTLRHVFWQHGWSEIIDTEVPIPSGIPMAISRQPGTTDLFITRSDGTVWHGFYPRKPL